MSQELISHWSEYRDAAQRVLLLATRSIRIFDPDLARLELENRENALSLRRFLTAAPGNTLRIVLRNAGPFRNRSPRLFQLLADFPHAVTVWECAPQLQQLTDALFLADDRHALARIHEDHARSRLIIDDVKACQPYLTRFAEILEEGGTPISATTLGL
ncbi:MAG: hypothetical protein LBI59_11445 [Candidatus Accumulibacter sp.]|jgi:hypothetical protein|nr:hypothetical protein [Accumulibacter sp.]